MKSFVSSLWFLTAMLILPQVNVHAATLDCANGIVSTDDSRVDLLMKCGEPDAKDSHDEELTEKPDPTTKRKTFITIEDWTYNFGPTQFVRIVTLRNGKIANIRSGNYGYSKTETSVQRDCSEQLVSEGDLKSDVVAKCGEPAAKDIRQEEVKTRVDQTTERSIFITIEEWTYNLGPNRFLRILTFRNGKLKDIRTGGYGYQMKEQEKRKAP